MHFRDDCEVKNKINNQYQIGVEKKVISKDEERKNEIKQSE